MLKHVGKMQNNGAKVAVVFRTLPGESDQALVVGTTSLPSNYHDGLMNLIQDPAGQNSDELGEILSVRKFTDGVTMLEGLHVQGFLKKVRTNMVLMTPTAKDSILLSELNAIIAEQKGVAIDDLAITNGMTPKSKNKKIEEKPEVVEDLTKTSSASVNTQEESVQEIELTPAQLRSKADKLFKEAQLLRKQADTIDPPKTKKKTVEG